MATTIIAAVACVLLIAIGANWSGERRVGNLILGFGTAGVLLLVVLP